MKFPAAKVQNRKMYYVSKMFTHPSNVCMSYAQHFAFALEMAWYLGTGCLKSILHAFLPDYWVTSTTDTVDRIQRRLQESGCRNESSSYERADSI